MTERQSSDVPRNAFREDFLDDLDEELELELDDFRLDQLTPSLEVVSEQPRLERHFYFRELIRLQRELI
jgi:hypothetical protein